MYTVEFTEEEFRLTTKAFDSYLRLICQRLSVAKNAPAELKSSLSTLIDINVYFQKLDKIYDDTNKKLTEQEPPEENTNA